MGHVQLSPQHTVAKYSKDEVIKARVSVLGQLGYGDFKPLKSGFENHPIAPVALWEQTNRRPYSLSGVKLEGDKLVKFVYADESGISVNESILVVAGVIIDADRQWKLVEQYIDELIAEYVPETHRKGFVFHATDLFHGSGQVFDRRRYPIERSHEALKKLISIPSQFLLPIVFGFYKKQPLPDSGKNKAKLRRIETSKNHAFAFSLCVVAAESFMKNETSHSEIAELIVELNTETRGIIKIMHDVLKARNLELPERMELFSFLCDSHPDALPITRIIDTVHFVEKNDAFLLQIADACALIIRYTLEAKPNTQEFINALTPDASDKIRVYNQAPGGLGTIKFART